MHIAYFSSCRTNGDAPLPVSPVVFPCHLHPCACRSAVTRSSQSGTTCLWVVSSLRIPLWRQTTPWSLTLQRYSRDHNHTPRGGVGWWHHSHRGWSGWAGPQSQGVEWVGGTTVTGGGVGGPSRAQSAVLYKHEVCGVECVHDL